MKERRRQGSLLSQFIKTWFETEPRKRLQESGLCILRMSRVYSIRKVPGDSRSWESPEKADNVWRLFIQILFR